MLKLAWRNIWRNKRRTLITVASIFFAIFFSIIMESLQSGAWSNLLNQLVVNFSGHIQIQNKNYYKNPNINNLMPYTKNLKNKLDLSDNINKYSPVFHTGALASSGEISKIAFINGIETGNKEEITNIQKNLIKIYFSETVIKELQNKNIPVEIIDRIKTLKTKYYKNEIDLLLYLKLSKEEKEKYIKTIVKTANFNSDSLFNLNKGVAIGFELAKFLDLQIGDSIIILGQGYHGATAAGKYRVLAFLKFPSFEFNNSIIYMPINNAQLLFSAYEISDNSQDTTYLINYVKITSAIPVSLQKSNTKKLFQLQKQLEILIDNNELAVVTWRKINEEMTQVAMSKQQSSKIISGLLYLIISFGIFGTVLMMIAERKREFQIMLAIGMKQTKMALTVIFEMFLLGLLGIISGSIASMPIVLLGYYYPIRYTGSAAEMFQSFNVEPIIPFAKIDLYYINQGFTVLFIVGIVIIFPIIKLLKTKPI